DRAGDERTRPDPFPRHDPEPRHRHRRRAAAAHALPAWLRARRAAPGRAGVSPALLLLLQLAVILLAARGCGRLLRRFGQPAVVGAMLAGLLLGPLVVGQWLPALHSALCAAPSLPALSGLATLGVTFFMFVVGVELRAPLGSRSQLRSAFAIGLT